MAHKTVQLKLTLKEARALRVAAGNSMDSPDDARDVLVDRQAVNAGYRALEKLTWAIIAANRSKKSKETNP